MGALLLRMRGVAVRHKKIEKRQLVEGSLLPENMRGPIAYREKVGIGICKIKCGST